MVEAVSTGVSAAFRRLCVETKARTGEVVLKFQPPSGGCVLKPRRSRKESRQSRQPPSGGCVLKPRHIPPSRQRQPSAAFRRLCVETIALRLRRIKIYQPPSGGCVLKLKNPSSKFTTRLQPPSGGCVLKLLFTNDELTRLIQPPSGGCVLKPFRLNLPRLVAAQPPSGGCVLKPLYAARRA